MWTRHSSEKDVEDSHIPQRMESLGQTATVLCQHGLFWSSLFVIAGTTFLLIKGGLATDVLVSECFLVANGSMSLLYLTLHTIATLSSSRRSRRRAAFQKLSTYCLRFSVTVGLLTCGLAITFTMARHPQRVRSDEGEASPLDVRKRCIVQRTTVAASLLALVLSGILFILMHRIHEPFRCHLFGISKEETLLPLMLPYKTSIHRPNPMFSEISFKCRSSSTLSSHTLVPSSYHESTTSLLPKQPEKAVKLGIYTPRSSMPSFLGPRPSLSSMRSHASIHIPPPSSPLPPLPTYFPEGYRRGSAMHKAVYPPQRPQRPVRRPSERTVRIVPPSPALSLANLEVFNRSTASLSSVYSRSITGERYTPQTQLRPGSLTDGRSFSSSSTATVKRSPLGIMRLASDPDIVFGQKRRSVSDISDSDIDDVATLQARLPPVKAVSDFGEVSEWEGQGHVSLTYYQKSYEVCIGEMKKVDFTPSNIRRTRDSVAMFHSSVVKTVA